MRAPRFLLILSAMAPLAPLVLLGAFAFTGHNEQIAQAFEKAERRSYALSEHIGRILDAQKQFIAMVDLMTAGGADIPQALKKHADGTAMVAGAFVIDQDGNIIASSQSVTSPINVYERAYFQKSLQTNDPVIGTPIRGRVTGREVFTISQRRAPPAKGVILISISTDYIASIFETALQKDAFDGVVSLVRSDGTMLVRNPPLPGPTILSPNSGIMSRMRMSDTASYRRNSEVDGQDRVYSYNRIGNWPLYLTYGIDVDSALGPWRKQMAIYALIAMVGSVVLAALAMLTWKQARADAVMAAELRRQVAERTAEAERRAAEAERASAEKAAALRIAEQASAHKSHFLAAASHDLRQPAQALRLFIETMTHEADTDRQKRIASLASESLHGLEQLLQTLLDVSVLDAGTATVALADVELRPLFRRLAADFMPQATLKGLELVVVETTANACTDPVHLERILRNLISNSIKYTQSGRVLLGVRHHGPELRIEVWDTGIGIPDELVERIFDDFFQLHNEARNRELGFGLGLGIVRRTAELLGHGLTVRSAPGKGTVFALTLRTTCENCPAREEMLLTN